jgi:hypothetical protein
VPIFYGELWQPGEQKIDSRHPLAGQPAGRSAALSDSPDCPFSPRAGLSVYKSAAFASVNTPFHQVCAIMPIIRTRRRSFHVGNQRIIQSADRRVGVPLE